jgi:hypothetical protein
LTCAGIILVAKYGLTGHCRFLVWKRFDPHKLIARSQLRLGRPSARPVLGLIFLQYLLGNLG